MGSKLPEQQSRHFVLCVGEKEAFCAVNVSCFTSKDLTCLDLFGLTAFASVAWSLGGFGWFLCA